MEQFPPLAAMGRRITIMGPTNAGKSTLAVAIADQLGIPAVHIDRFRHLAGTDWQERPEAEFVALHEAAIAEPAWVMDGNYSSILPPRLARATGLIVVDESLIVRYLRYFWRSTMLRERAGALDGNRDSIKWAMISWLWTTRHVAEKYRRLALSTGLPTVICRDERQLNLLYEAWGLGRRA